MQVGSKFALIVAISSKFSFASGIAVPGAAGGGGGDGELVPPHAFSQALTQPLPHALTGSPCKGRRTVPYPSRPGMCS